MTPVPADSVPLPADFAQFVTLEEAQAAVRAALPGPGTEWVAPEEAFGRRLAAPLQAKVAHPSATESALDGIAARAADTQAASAQAPVTLRIVGESRAGQPFAGEVGPGECVRIYTGAPLPPGADAICPVEQLEFRGEGEVSLLTPARTTDVRHLGDDFAPGDELLAAGTRLTPARVALAVAGGHAQLPVLRRWRVALLSTGDELKAPGSPLAPGEVYDSNRYGLRGLLLDCGAEVLDLGRAPDDVAELAARLDAVGGADLLLTSGGVSMGRYDFMRDLLLERGEVTFWKIRLRPGGPTLLGRWNGLSVLGLPGNPVSSLVVFELLVRPALTGEGLRTARLRAGAPFGHAGQKTAFWRGELRGGEVVPYPKQSSGVLRSLSDAQVLVRVDPAQLVAAGDEVEVLWLG
ncbi:molybdopterin molybdenumtransferase MoeA [Deinococcus piscis]|uniref:Molybdopterin molybdenumtransferase n=1 Tax=Deinococcus piscis TaxID=394230 RepID=A0ABQ3KAX7_9DEIO|nr:gephyrin-like molybdotransferase Glp [Deinococcus piscis]GHG07371.1 molybdopterin molybdenumtransferase MoeA [Deinococcus piscis]